MNNNLNRLQQCELYIAKEIKKICDANHIPYTMMGGTLIGAVRHKGFIPWDDDIDFAMSRENYNKFLKTCMKSLSPEFEIQDWHKDKYFEFPHSKILLKNTTAVERAKQNSKCKNMIFVDVFPFDKIPNSHLQRFIHSVPCYYYKKLAWLKFNPDILNFFSGTKHAVFSFLYKCSEHFEKEEIIQRFEKYTNQFNNKNTKTYASICGAYGYFKEIIPVSFFESYIELPFEDTTFMAMAHYDDYLRQVFGDYMQLPPEEKRRVHSMVKLDFGDFFERHPELDISDNGEDRI